MNKIKRVCFSLCLISLFMFLGGCCLIRRAAVQQVAETFSGKTTQLVISSDNDPELIWDAMPFALKTMEIMLAHDPENSELYLAAATGYILYANGNLSQKAQMLEDTDFRKAHLLWKRAYNLNLRGHNYAFNALELRYPGFKKQIKQNAKTALSQTTVEDVPFLYWAALGWAAAITCNKNDMNIIAELPAVEAMMNRVLELDPNFEDGAVHDFFIAYDGGRPKASGGSRAKAEKHFKEAIKCSNGEKALPYVIFAETVAVNEQNLPLFKKLLNQALAVDVNKVKKWRLANTIAHQKALWLKTQIPNLFVEYNDENKQ